MEIVVNFISQLIFTVGVIFIFGLIISLCRTAFCKIVGENGNKILVATGIVGTPVHELSHALMCLVFGHKIVEIKLYQPSSDGTLGYVNHSYNPKNIYHQIGNFFIGIAPIICGSGIILLLMYLLTPSMFVEVTSELKFVELLTFDLLDPSTFAAVLDIFWSIIEIMFDFTNFGNILWWIFIILAILISSHMELSGADIKGGLIGLLYIAIILLVVDIVLYFVSKDILSSITTFCASASLCIVGFLSISIVFSGVLILIAFVIKGIISIVSKKSK